MSQVKKHTRRVNGKIVSIKAHNRHDMKHLTANLIDKKKHKYLGKGNYQTSIGVFKKRSFENISSRAIEKNYPGGIKGRKLISLAKQIHLKHKK